MSDWLITDGVLHISNESGEVEFEFIPATNHHHVGNLHVSSAGAGLRVTQRGTDNKGRDWKTSFYLFGRNREVFVDFIKDNYMAPVTKIEPAGVVVFANAPAMAAFLNYCQKIVEGPLTLEHGPAWHEFRTLYEALSQSDAAMFPLSEPALSNCSNCSNCGTNAWRCRNCGCTD